MDDQGISSTRFIPALWEQRRFFILDQLKQHNAKRIMDYGCGECSVTSFLISPGTDDDHHFDHLVGIDIDPNVLEEAKTACQPWPTDYTQLRDWPLTVDLYQGSVDNYDERFQSMGCDAWICSEVIEHLHEDTLHGLRTVLFGHYAPPLVIVTTPNAEYNHHFPNLFYGTPHSQFRHDDHKFEWTRAEFQAWCLGIADEYGYTTEFHGIGLLHGQQDQLEHGHCSQACVLTKRRSNNLPPPLTNRHQHQHIAHYEYPFYQEPPLPDSDILTCIDGFVADLCQAKMLEVHEKTAAQQRQAAVPSDPDLDLSVYSWPTVSQATSSWPNPPDETTADSNQPMAEEDDWSSSSSDSDNEHEAQVPASDLRTFTPMTLTLASLWSILRIRQLCKSKAKLITLLERHPHHYEVSGTDVVVHKAYPFHPPSPDTC
ncbi:hypothetical protein DM01DRAFT_1335464 [Hesseltinella vesiculosa]|uniref:Small RNA 2'-O-methyltransferase n=1 Tax=Hesseltinella vesiculosa TaxID=101127 RepID=A0A1X2GJL2_9FUNG|nr:hypothetical protein DM01DRAFT_1335464 [Hesseltinella vesiculosa]